MQCKTYMVMRQWKVLHVKSSFMLFVAHRDDEDHASEVMQGEYAFH